MENCGNSEEPSSQQIGDMEISYEPAGPQGFAVRFSGFPRVDALPISIFDGDPVCGINCDGNLVVRRSNFDEKSQVRIISQGGIVSKEDLTWILKYFAEAAPRIINSQGM